MTRGRLGVALLALVVGLTAGCGSRKDSTATTESTGAQASGVLTPEAESAGSYALARVQKCLNAEGMKATPFTNEIVTGTGGELKVEFPDIRLGWIFIAFGKDAEEAQAIHDKAVDVAVSRGHLERDTVLAGVQTSGNVFYYSDGGPLTVIQREKVTACLN